MISNEFDVLLYEGSVYVEEGIRKGVSEEFFFVDYGFGDDIFNNFFVGMVFEVGVE